MNLNYDLKMLTNGGIQKMESFGLMPFFLILLVSLLVSLFISHLYLRFYGTKGTGSTLHRSFPLLGVSITAIFVSLQFSIPLSLGLLGALSIVRFRTPIKDPEEVGFILLVIASSLSCATFNLPFLSILLLIAIIGLIVLNKDKRLFRKSHKEGMLIIKVDKNEVQDINLVRKAIESYDSKLTSDCVVEDNLSQTYNYYFSKLQKEEFYSLQDELKNISKSIGVNIYYNNIEN